MAVRSASVETEDEQLGKVSRNNPDWFQESMGHLRSLLQESNAAYLRYVCLQRSEDHRKFKEARGSTKREIRRAKNRWFECEAQKVEKGIFGGKTVREGNIWRNNSSEVHKRHVEGKTRDTTIKNCHYQC